jgi:hypothetical protein
MPAETLALHDRSDEAAAGAVSSRAASASTQLVRVLRALANLCELGAREVSAPPVSRAELLDVLAQSSRALDEYHAALEWELRLRVDDQRLYGLVLHRHIGKCLERERAELTRLARCAGFSQAMQGTAQSGWATALAMRVELEHLLVDVEACGPSEGCLRIVARSE